MPHAVCFRVKPVGKPDAVVLHVRFDERGWETGLQATALSSTLLIGNIVWAVEEELNKKADAMSEKHLGVNILVLKLEYERMFERQYEFKPSLSYRLLEKTGKYSRIDKLRDKYIDLNFKINHRSLSAAQVNAYLYPTQKILFGVSALIAISCSVAFFLIVKITTRSIKGLGLWILKGFKE